MRVVSKIEAQSEEDESLDNDDHRAHVEYDDHIEHMRKDARTSHLGNENDLHGCRLGDYSITSDEEVGFSFERTMKKNDKNKPPYT